MEFGLGDNYNMFRERKKKNKRVSNWNYSHPQMRFNCWFDRSASGYCCILDLPMNMVQKKIEFEIDRQSEMDMMDDKRKK